MAPPFDVRKRSRPFDYVSVLETGISSKKVVEGKLRARLSELDATGTRAVGVREANKVHSMIEELEKWEREVIYALAHKSVPIDLDDGMKVNYNRFPRLLAKVPRLSG